MKNDKVYMIISIIALLALVIWNLQLRKELNETEEVLQQCSDRYYKEVLKE